MEPNELLEFAELICGRKPYVELDGSVTQLFTIQLRVFRTHPSAPREPQDLPMVCFRPEQAIHLPDGLRAGLMRWIPEAMPSPQEASSEDSSGTPNRRH